MYSRVITKINYILLALGIIAKLSIIFAFTFCDENSIHSSCNCSTIINLNQMDKMCKCDLTSKVYNISCPETNTGLTIEVKQTNFSKQINIRCIGILIYEEFEQLLPTIKLGNIEDMAIERCPIIRCNGISNYEKFNQRDKNFKIRNVEDIAIERCPIEQINSNLSALVQLSLGVTNYEKLLYAIKKPLNRRLRRIQFNTPKSRESFDRESVTPKVHVFNIDVDFDRCVKKLIKNKKALFAPDFILQIDDNISSNMLLSKLRSIWVYGTTVVEPMTFVDEQETPSRLPPKFLSNMHNLQSVHIRSFLSLPEDLFINSTNIKYVFVMGCNIKHFPNNLFESQHDLKMLYLKYNKLEYLPNDSLRNAKKLEDLDLSYNQLKGFSSLLVQHCSKLRVLYLSDLGFTAQNIEFEKSFTNLTALQYIDLSLNKITHIPKNWHIPCRLKRLNLQSNWIFMIGAKELKHLISDNLILDLSYNRINTVNFQDLEEVRQLSNTNITTDLQHNPIHCDCDLLNFILYLRHDIGEYIRNNIKFITNYLSCDAPKNLKGKPLQQFQINCYKDDESIDLLCTLHPSVCPNNFNCWRRNHEPNTVPKTDAFEKSPVQSKN